MAITIKKSELNKLIMEEALKYKKALALKKELASIDKELNEVHPGGDMAPGADGVHAGQKKPVFATKGNPNLKMEDDIEGTESTEGVEDAPISEIEKLCLDLGKALEAKINSITGADAEGVEGDDEELEFDEKDLGDEGEAAETAIETAPEEAEEEKEEEEAEVTMETENPKEEECVVPEVAKPEEEKVMEENLDEPIEGESVAQKVDADTVNDNMEKDKHVKEGAETEGETLLSEEKKRMAFLAGILKS